jgi:hypothetical protein
VTEGIIPGDRRWRRRRNDYEARNCSWGAARGGLAVGGVVSVSTGGRRAAKPMVVEVEKLKDNLFVLKGEVATRACS